MPNSENFIFIHGLGLSSTIWEPIKPLVKGNCLCPDLLGHGNSPSGVYNFESLWEYLSAELKYVDWSSTTLIMHSMSSALLPEISKSRIYPKSICLIEANLILEDAHWSHQICQKSSYDFSSWFSKFKANSELVLGMQLEKSHKKNDLVLWSSGFKQVDKLALRQLAKELLKLSSTKKIISAIRKIDSPTSYFRGSKSQPWTEGEQILKKLGIPLFVIPNASHYPMLDNPIAVWESITAN